MLLLHARIHTICCNLPQSLRSLECFVAFLYGDGVGRLIAVYSNYIPIYLLILEDQDIRIATQIAKTPLR